MARVSYFRITEILLFIGNIFDRLGEVLAKRKEGSRVGFMTPQKTKTTSESIELFKQTLEGNNYSPQSIKAYMGDLGQFVEWLKTRRVDWDIPYRIARIDIVEFINHLGSIRPRPSHGSANWRLSGRF